jgi:hypothetical protein
MTLGSFQTFSKIRRDIRKSRCTISINDSIGKFATVSTTPVANFATCSAGEVDTGGKFVTGVNDTGGKLEKYQTAYMYTLN